MGTRIFDPWVGSKYREFGFQGVRVLILGESHYDPPENESEYAGFTRKVVREWGQRRRAAFFTKIVKVALGMRSGEWISNEARAEFWEQVAFCNFVQSFLSTARQRPSQEMWEDAKSPLFEVLEITEPRLILALGYELASHLPKLPSPIEVCAIEHPSSSRFSYEPWTENFKSALQKALYPFEPPTSTAGV